MWYWHNGMDGWGWLGMGLFMLVFWGLVILGIVLLVRLLNSSGPPNTSSRRPIPTEILDERLARGDIDEGEYHLRMAALRASKARPVDDDRKAG
jgi:putative membrane protein